VFVKEPKLVVSLAPTADGGIPYRHITVFDDSEPAQVVGQCNVGNLPDADEPSSSCQVSRALLERGASRLRFDDGLAGCGASECFHASFRAYPDGTAPHTSRSYRWANERYGLYRWAELSDARACFGLWGHRRDNDLDGSLDSARSCGQRGDARGPEPPSGGCVDVRGESGLPRQWELHRLGGSAQALVAGWTGGRGGYDCPLALRAFGPEGEAWAIYANYSYGPGWDLQS
jgi:hypothetical protein